MKQAWVSFLLGLALCSASTVNAGTKVWENRSGFDGSLELHVNPHVTGMSKDWTSLELGAAWNSQSPEVVLIKASSTLRSLPTAISFNVDGTVITLDEAVTGPSVERPVQAIQVTRTFKASFEEFRKIAHGTRVWVRLQTLDGYKDFPLVDRKAQPAYTAFGRLAERIDAEKNVSP